MKEYVVHLTPEERSLLEDMRSKGVHRSREIRRAAILLKSESGLIDTAIAADVGCSLWTVERTRKRFCMEGLESALKDKPRSGQPQKIDARIEAEVVAFVCSTPPEGYNRWTLELLKRESDKRCSKSLSKGSLQKILKKHQLKPWKKRCGVCQN
jgi:transposase